MATATIINGFTQLHACDATNIIKGNKVNLNI